MESFMGKIADEDFLDSFKLTPLMSNEAQPGDSQSQSALASPFLYRERVLDRLLSLWNQHPVYHRRDGVADL